MNDDIAASLDAITLDHPTASDGAEIHRIARDSRVLDVNSPYAYVLWCNDFGETSVAARAGDEVVGFITGYRRPTQTFMVWQIAVDARFRRRGLGLQMLEWLADAAARFDPREFIIETTVARDNSASRAMFAKFAERRAMELDELPGFESGLFPGDHLAEPLLRMTPITTKSVAAGTPAAARNLEGTHHD